MNEQQKLKDRISQLTFRRVITDIDIITNCCDFMRIYAGQVYRLEGKDFLIRSDTYESRFGIADQPKSWVKHAIELDTGSAKIMKFIFYEEFISNIGPLRIRCYRDPQKESNVLKLVLGNPHFMHGITMADEGSNPVRVLDFIRGQTLYAYIFDCELSHEEYYYEQLPWILTNIIKCLGAIKLLHDNGLCHGDIRNDHIYIERDTNIFRWIDFDLAQNYRDFDLWSIGNILNYIIGKGIRSYHELHKSQKFSQSVRRSVTRDDASAFYNYRIMNLKKLYPYISKKLNDILLQFTINTQVFYENIENIIDDLNDALSEFHVD